MNFFSSVSRLGRKLLGNYRFDDAHDSIERLRICRLEEMEPRQYLTANIHLGGVFYEDASGNDGGAGDLLEISFQGGAPGTQLTHIHISGDKDGDGLTSGDIFFDTAPGGSGSFGSAPLKVESHVGFQVLSATTVDGSTELDVTLSGFVAGDKLILSVDLDEAQYVNPAINALDTNAIVEGGEFQRSHLTGDFVAPHFNNISGSALYWDAYDSNFAAADLATGTHLDLQNDQWDPVQDLSDRTAGAVTSLTQIPLPISLAGTVYADANVNNHQDAGDAGIGGVKLSLLKLDGTQYVSTGMTTTTDAQGNYRFTGLLPNEYRVVETQPTGYFSVGATAGTVGGQTRGVVTTPDILSDIQLLGGDDSIQNDFAEALPNSISGHVLVDLNGDCIQQPGEPSLQGVVVHLLDSSDKVIGTTTTDVDGNYHFTNLAPGTYGVRKEMPAGYFDDDSHVGTAGGVVIDDDEVDGIKLTSAIDGMGYNFCVIPPAGISGFVYSDLNNNGVFDTGEKGIAGVTLNLVDAQGKPTGATTKTDATGHYDFDGLFPAVYGVAEVQPAGYYDGLDSAGSEGGTAHNPGDLITGADLKPSIEGVNYNFGELLPASISGHVLVDLNGDCIQQPGEPSLANVTIHLLDASNKIIGTTTTDIDGNYHFSNLAPGTYGVEKVLPAGYFNDDSHAGSAGGVVVSDDMVNQIPLGPAVDGIHYDFCVELPGSISGHVLVDTNGDCVQQPGEVLLSGVVIHLLDSSGNIIQTTTTGDDGLYHFTNLAPGTYGVEKEQPDGYFRQASHIGSAGGVIVNLDEVDEIQIGSGVDGTGYNYCIVPPAQLCGFVYSDLNNDGIKEDGEQGIAGVTLHLLDAQGNPTGITATTDATGEYCFTGLHPGTYGVSEDQPAGYYDGLDTPGDAGGTAHNPGDQITGAVLQPAMDADNYNFGELLPASITGHVLVDTNGDCIQQPGEVLLAGVTIHLLDSDGNIIQTTTTGDDGNYHFDNLAPGTYGVAKVQPADYFRQASHVGSAGGESVDLDEVDGAQLGPGVNATGYNYCIVPPGMIAGIVFQDGPAIPANPGQAIDVESVRTGQYKPGDPLLAGVTLELRNGVTGEPLLGSVALAGYYAPDSPIRTVTDASGHYQFGGLPAGNYAVFEVQPTNYIDGLDTPGTLGGIAFNPKADISPQILEAMAADVHTNNDAIIRIALPAAQLSLDNNFSEVITTPPSHPIPPELPSPPPPPPPQGFYVQPAPPPPFMPPSPLLYTPPPRYYGSDLVDYTWHLSVINAGQPRDSEVSESSVQLTAVTTEEIVAWQKALSESEWILATRNSDGGVSVRHVVFGVKGGIPVTGDFNGDGITDVGVFKDGQWFIDLNGNGVWDEGDLWAKLGTGADKPVTGDWDGDGKTDIGIYGPAWAGDPRAVAEEPGIPNSQNWHVDVHKNIPRPPQKTPLGLRALKRTVKGDVRADVIDHVFHYGTPGDVPVTGDWNGDGTATIGIFHDGNWYLDLDGDGKWTEKDGVVHFGQKGDIPVVGDWDGKGTTQIGVYRNGAFYLDTNGNHRLDDDDEVIQLGGVGDVPVVGDWDGSGQVQVGVYHDAEGVRSVNAGAASIVPTPSAER